jgi:hypothetical protein
MTEVDRGIMVVSSSYSADDQSEYQLEGFVQPTFLGVLVVDGKFKVRPVTQSTLADDLSLELEDRYTGAIKSYPRRLFLGLEFEMNGR